MQKLSLNLPHYTVGNSIYVNKIEAVLAANLTQADIEWNFYPDKFGAYDWTLEPWKPLSDLYRERAQQIRDRYDYVVLLCSGGADSTNVLYSFLDNNIKVDEIIASAPMEGLRDYQFNNKDTSHHNTMSETFYTQLPLIQKIAQLHPEIKVTLNDYFGDILNYKSDKWILDCDDWIHPSSAARYRFEKHSHLRDLADKGKKVAFVYGIDKPNVIIGTDNSINLTFSDLAVNVMRPPFDREYPNVDNVMFYWDPDNLDCLAKQAHTTARWLFKPENSKALDYVFKVAAPPPNFETFRARQSKYERAIVPCIYPDTFRPIFQAEKPIKICLGEHDTWFYTHHSGTRSHEMMVSDTKNLFKNINRKYINKGKNGFKMYSAYYRIGEVSDFKAHHHAFA